MDKCDTCGSTDNVQVLALQYGIPFSSALCFNCYNNRRYPNEVLKWWTRVQKKKPSAYVFDIDNTLANNKHRVHHILGEKKDWDAFYEDSLDDEIIEATYKILRSIFQDFHIILCTGRHEKNREITEKWLEEKHIPFAELYMRPNDDRRKDYIVKADLADQILEKYDVIAVFEDKPKVCDMWRDKGVFVFEIKGDKDE